MKPKLSILLVVLVIFTVLFVIGDVAERHLFPEISIALHHFLLTVRATLATLVASAAVFFIMRRQNEALSKTARQLTGLLGAYRDRPQGRLRFENPHLLHCRKVLDCKNAECQMYDAPGERCWQQVGLKCPEESDGKSVDFLQCRDCVVYQRSCPDSLTQLGESFNNLMFLLEEEDKQIGRMQSQMLEKEKMVAVGQMAAGVAHEIGNPLSSISSVVQMLQRSELNAGTGEQFKLIETHIQRISGTVRQLGSLARPGADRWERVELGEVLRDVAKLVGFDRRARNCTIDFESPNHLPMTYGLPGQLQQVFINLALNALDAMPEGGTLTMRARAQRDDILVTVSDTGTGIPARIGRRVFEPFFTTKDAGRGSGLGLSVTYGILQKHGGSIDFETQVNQGTTFVVLLPVLNQPPES